MNSYIFKEAFLMPFTTISKKILCEDLLPLFPLPSSSTPMSIAVPMSVSYYEDVSQSDQTSYHDFIDYISFRVPDEPFSDIANCIGIARGFMHDVSNVERGCTSLEVVLLSVPAGYNCVDLSLYKESQLVLLLNETSTSSENSGEGSSRGVACVFAARKRALVYILEEDEDIVSDTE
ncbi:hypothetical protein Patl1_10879 [Pistacia atlantica]|uniref:Uncharacterized protein n=1 Tax=Pistacia atlantica TaxID=434234 RepID=A0ACC1A764_9ROSI|nr:hypothetical protein Patl1_10879 [Pistacia atlantica]